MPARNLVEAMVPPAQTPDAYVSHATGDSMEPLLPANCYLVVKKVPFERLTIGDVVSYYNDKEQFHDSETGETTGGTTLNHMVARIGPKHGTWYMRGMHNKEGDKGLLTKDNYYGLVVQKVHPIVGGSYVPVNDEANARLEATWKRADRQSYADYKAQASRMAED